MPPDPALTSALAECDQLLAAAEERGDALDVPRIRNTAASIADHGAVDPIDAIRMRMHRKRAAPPQDLL